MAQAYREQRCSIALTGIISWARVPSIIEYTSQHRVPASTLYIEYPYEYRLAIGDLLSNTTSSFLMGDHLLIAPYRFQNRQEGIGSQADKRRHATWHQLHQLAVIVPPGNDRFLGSTAAFTSAAGIDALAPAACSASTGMGFLNRIVGWSTSDSTPETDTFIGERSTRSQPFPLARIHFQVKIQSQSFTLNYSLEIQVQFTEMMNNHNPFKIL